MQENKRLGEFIRARRKALKLSQQDLAERLCVRSSFVSALENGAISPPSEPFLRALARELEEDITTIVSLAGQLKIEFE